MYVPTAMRRSNPLLIWAVAIGGGIGLGLLAFGVSLVLWPIILGPIILGALGAFALKLAVNQARMRSVSVAIVAGLLMGLITYGVYQAGEYWNFQRTLRSDMLNAFEAQGGDSGTITAEQLDFAVDSFLEDEVGATGLTGYLTLIGRDGMSISRTGSSSDGLAIKGGFFWAMLLLELAIITGMMIYGAYGAARAAFCQQCGEWYPGAGRSLGRASAEAGAGIAAALQAGDLRGALAQIQPNASLMPAVSVTVHPCSTDPSHDLLVRVNALSMDRKNNLAQNVLAEQRIPASQARELVPPQSQVAPDLLVG